MMSIRAQSTAAVSRQNSSQDENSGETQSTSSQNSPAGKISQNLIPEDDQVSPQNLLIISSPLNRQLTRSIFEDIEMLIISVLVKAREISSLNKSAD